MRAGRGNWGRWGDDDQRGALNLVDDAKRAAAAALVRTGRSVSLSRPIDAEFELTTHAWDDTGAGYAHDRLTIACHNYDTTHIDALCHIWDADGMWGGRDPGEVLAADGARWADIDQWGEGIVTRGVLLDVPALRGEDHVAVGRPVHGTELDEAASRQGVTLEPGDAVCVYGGREAWARSGQGAWPRPGLHTSCLEFLRDHDVAVLAWDLIDARPAEEGLSWPVHDALLSYGVALVDHALLEPLALACRDEGRYEFMFVVAPLRIPGGTGSPVNPLAVL